MKIEVLVHRADAETEIYNNIPADRDLNEMLKGLLQHFPSATRFDIQITPRELTEFEKIGNEKVQQVGPDDE